MDQLLLELKKLPRPQPILLGAVIAFLGLVLYAYREVIHVYWLPRWGDPKTATIRMRTLCRRLHW